MSYLLYFLVGQWHDVVVKGWRQMYERRYDDLIRVIVALGIRSSDYRKFNLYITLVYTIGAKGIHQSNKFISFSIEDKPANYLFFEYNFREI